MGRFTLHNWWAYVQCVIKSHNLSLTVDFLFQSFLVITVDSSVVVVFNIALSISKEIMAA